jgi:hypothetical protein
VVAIKRAVHASLSAAPGIPQVFPWRATRPVAKGNTTSHNTTAPRAKYPRGKAGKIDRRTWMVYVSDQAKWASKNQRSRNDQCKTAFCSKRFEQEVSICAKPESRITDRTNGTWEQRIGSLNPVSVSA